jgi:hypothetical protein
LEAKRAKRAKEAKSFVFFALFASNFFAALAAADCPQCNSDAPQLRRDRGLPNFHPRKIFS